MRTMSLLAAWLAAPLLSLAALLISDPRPALPPLFCHPQSSSGNPLDVLSQQVIAPYVEVRTEGGCGSGTVIEVRGQTLVLTAGHVVAGCVRDTRSIVKDRNGQDIGQVERHYQPVTLCKEAPDGKRTWRAEIVLYSPDEEHGGHDLALLRPEDPGGLVAARVGTDTTLKPGMDCWYVGTPMGLHRSLEKSIINRTDLLVPELNGNTYVVTNGHGTFGNSGGGLFVRADEPGAPGTASTIRIQYVLVGVIVRAANGGTKPCVMCQRPETIAAFLALYR